MRRLLKGRLVLGLALLCTVAVYARAIHFDFVYDDWQQIVRNSHLESAAYIPIYFTADVWSQRGEAQSNYYRPAYLCWLLVNRALFGVSPAGWHATSVFLHLAAIFLLYIAASEVLSDPLWGAFAAFLFAVHPANLEGVAWVSCSSELLMGIFLLSAFLMYLRFRANGRFWLLVASTISFGLALGCKETACAFLPILLWQEWLGPRCAIQSREGQLSGKISTSPVFSLAPYFLAVALYFEFRVMALGQLLGGAHIVTRAVALVTLPSVLLRYFRLLVLPFGLSPFYDIPYTQTIASARFVLPVVMLLLIAGVFWNLCRRSSAKRVALGWVLLPLLPPLAGLTEFVPGDLIHDRYLYLSTMGFAILVAAFAKDATWPGWERPLKVLPFLAAGVFECLSIIQLGYWKNNRTLYERGVRISPRSIVALDTLANDRFRRNDLTGAISAYERSLAVDPNSWKTNFAFALTLCSVGEDGRAIPLYRHAINIDPQNIQQYMLLAQAQQHEGHYLDAEQTIVHGLRVGDNLAQLHYALGSLLERRGDVVEARVQYKRALALNPGMKDAANRVSALNQPKPAS